MDHYQNSARMMRLNHAGKAKPAGPSGTKDSLQWVRTFGGRVIYIGLVLRQQVKL